MSVCLRRIVCANDMFATSSISSYHVVHSNFLAFAGYMRQGERKPPFPQTLVDLKFNIYIKFQMIARKELL